MRPLSGVGLIARALLRPMTHKNTVRNQYRTEAFRRGILHGRPFIPQPFFDASRPAKIVRLSH